MDKVSVQDFVILSTAYADCGIPRTTEDEALVICMLLYPLQ